MYRSRPLVLLIALLTACGAEVATVAEPSCGSGADCASRTPQLHPDTVHRVEGRDVALASNGRGRSPLEARPCSSLPLTDGEAAPPLDGACVLWSAGTPGEARDPSDPKPFDQSWAAKPSFTLSCWHAGGSCDLGGGGSGTYTVQPLSTNSVTAGAIFSTGSPGDVKVRVKIVP